VLLNKEAYISIMNLICVCGFSRRQMIVSRCGLKNLGYVFFCWTCFTYCSTYATI